MSQLRGLGFKEEQFEPFAVDRLVDNSTTDFDLFLNVSNHFILYGSLGYRWVKDELNELLRHGHSKFYTRKDDIHKVKMYEKLVTLPDIDTTLAPKDRIVAIQEVGKTFTQYLYEGELTPSCVEKAAQIATALTACVMEDNSCIQALSGLADHDSYVYLHSVRVACYATATAVEMGLTDEVKLREIAVGGLFHDIGKKDVGLHIINKKGPLTDDEWKVMRAHPILGHQAVQTTNLTYVPRAIVLYHHEKPDGSGYPHGLDKSSLITEVAIATVADVYDALTSSRSYQTKRNTFEALDFIKHKFLAKNHLDPEAFISLVKCLAKSR